MATRNYLTQPLHDKVITIAAANITNWIVHTNPGQEKNAHIGNVYPDIILTNKTTDAIEIIIEVETEDSVTAHEAYNQWKKYMNLPGVLYILVPAEQRENAEFLCTEYNIRAKIATFWKDRSGLINIAYQ